MCEQTKNLKITLTRARELYKKGFSFVDDFLLSNWTVDELTKPTLPSSFEELKITSGYRIFPDNIIRIDTFKKSKIEDSYRTHKEARSVQAMAKLSHLMKFYNEDWEPNWNESSNDPKYVIVRLCNKLNVEKRLSTYEYLTFKTESIANLFLSTFTPLIKQYYMI